MVIGGVYQRRCGLFPGPAPLPVKTCKDMKQFYSQLKEALKDLSDQKYGRILRMVQDYIDGKEPDTEKLSKNDRMIFSLAGSGAHSAENRLFYLEVRKWKSKTQDPTGAKKRRNTPLALC